MLALSRKVREQIVVGDGQVVIHVLRIKGDKVVIGVEAHPDVSIHRKEIYDRIKAGINE